MIHEERPKKVLVLGSGALQIGQAGEFDYSGSQALKALHEENIETVLINPNIASVQTDWEMADHVYFLPLEACFIEQVIKKEEVDSIIVSFGGQTALNCGLDLERQGILEKYNIRILGTSLRTIDTTEDRKLFALSLAEIGVPVAEHEFAYSTEEAISAAEKMGFPVMIRSAYTLGGKGSKIIHNTQECGELADKILQKAPHLLIEECLSGWKEFEYEVMRDEQDNCIIICNMENVDPVGVHTGDSIVVAPSQTLDDLEYQLLRDTAFKAIRHLNIIGECNIQFALHKKSRTFKVIEVNARLSRSSALASKATGYPIAYVATKLILGYPLSEIKNAITGVTTAFFEPALDYVVCKIPRWDFVKFQEVSPIIGSEMRSVGEVMAIGRSFGEALLKALRMLDLNYEGLSTNKFPSPNTQDELNKQTPTRLFAISRALKEGGTCSTVEALTGIDQFFLEEIRKIVELESVLSSKTHLKQLDPPFMQQIKQNGISDRQISRILGASEEEVRERREQFNVKSHLHQIDTLAAEYPAVTNFTYLTYNSTKHDVNPSNKKEKILILGSGCYRIGSSVEFDWCAVNCAKSLKEKGYETILLNCNPETVSTDYDSCDILIFDEISPENIREINQLYKPAGVVVSMGGQTPNNLIKDIMEIGIHVLGTSPDSIDLAEDRAKFSQLLNDLDIDQPQWSSVSKWDDLSRAIEAVGGFPVIVRPSHVLSGTCMGVAHTQKDLKKQVAQAQRVSPQYPVTISKFEENAKEVEFDAVASRGEIVTYAIAEHVENAGVHSGDATLVLPSFSLSATTKKIIQEKAASIALHLNISGPFNIQFLIKDHKVKVIECNLRASRSLPFISKTTGVNFIRYAVDAMLSYTIPNTTFSAEKRLPYVAVKSPQFSFERLPNADPCLGIEMASTGEVACLDSTLEKALLLSARSAGFKLPSKGILLDASEGDDDTHKSRLFSMILLLGLPTYSIDESQLNTPNIISQESAIRKIKEKEIDLVISLAHNYDLPKSKLGFHIRRTAIEYGVSLLTNQQLAERLMEAILMHDKKQTEISSWAEYLDLLSSPNKGKTWSI